MTWPRPGGPAHKASTLLEGSLIAWWLPLCWEADARQRHGAEYDAEDWWTSVDHGSIDPTAIVLAVGDGNVTCADCVAWMRA